MFLASLLGGGPSLLHRYGQPLSACWAHHSPARRRSKLRCTTRSVSPFGRPTFFGGCDDSSAARWAQMPLAKLAISARQYCFRQGALPCYLPKSRNGAIDGRSLRLKLRNDILDVIHSRSFLWQLKWDLSNPATLVTNCLFAILRHDGVRWRGVKSATRTGIPEPVSRPRAPPSC